MGPLRLTAIVLGSVFLLFGLITWLPLLGDHPDGNEEPLISKSKMRLSLSATALFIGAIACGYVAFGTDMVNGILDLVDKSHTAILGILLLAFGVVGAVSAFRTREELGTAVGLAVFCIGEMVAAVVNFLPGSEWWLVYVIGPGSILPAVLLGWAISRVFRPTTANEHS